MEKTLLNSLEPNRVNEDDGLMVTKQNTYLSRANPLEFFLFFSSILSKGFSDGVTRLRGPEAGMQNFSFPWITTYGRLFAKDSTFRLRIPAKLFRNKSSLLGTVLNFSCSMHGMLQK